MIEKPTRYYFALTNLCNRACELCSCHSDPSRGTHLPMTTFLATVQQGEPYEAQLEGGEPTIHPQFWEMVAYLVNDPLCQKIILCTNAVKIPFAKERGQLHIERSIPRIQAWLARFAGKPFLLKPSINSHLVEHDVCHIDKMVALTQAFDQMAWAMPADLIFNVRRRPIPLTEDGDAWLTQRLKDNGLYARCNDFEYQRYGKAEQEEDLARPFIIANPVKFFLISPDGKNFGTDLIARANHMEKLD